jgi:hypothetical protein
MTEKAAKIWIALSLLASVIGGAFTAWRMSVVDDAAGDAVNDAMHALITDASASIRAGNDVYDRMRAFADYRVAQNAQDTTLAEAEAAKDEDDRAFYEQQAQDEGAAVTVAKSYFNQRYANRDGTYNTAADRRSSYNGIVGRRNTDSAAFLADAQGSRSKTGVMVLVLIGYALVLLLATLSEEFAPMPATIVSVFGLLTSIGLTIVTVMVEAGRLLA